MYAPRTTTTRPCACQAQSPGLGALSLSDSFTVWMIAAVAGVGLVWWMARNTKSAKLKRRRRAKAAARKRYQAEVKRIERAYA